MASCFHHHRTRYCATLAAEVRSPRKALKQAYRSIYARLLFFFVGSAVAVGIVVPSNDPTIKAIYSGTAKGYGTGAASPYIVAMQNLGIVGLPHLVNFLILTSIFSAGNSYCYIASRTLYSLAIDGHAPKVLRKCTKAGVPIYCFAITMLFPFLSFLILGSSASNVVNL